MQNTGIDLFLFADRYYLLVAGRWFSTKDLIRQWSAVKKLPEVFAQIPVDLDGGKRRVNDYGPRNYVGSGRYVMPDGSQYEGENSRSSAQAVAPVSSHDAVGDLYTDPEGRVFRKTAEGWQQYRDGNWSHLDRRDQEYVEWQYQARQEGYRNCDAYQQQKSQ